jgi:M6 family metalloprotease-like protein
MKSINLLLILLLVTIFTGSLYAEKLVVKKHAQVNKPKIHPYTNLLQASQKQTSIPKRDAVDNRLLVILVDFQEEIPDDPFTTGNGKFLFTADSTYQTRIACPPHDKEYFESNLKALKYYYLAASQNTYDLQYDVWPKDKIAYTLPHEMSYYNPAGAGSDLFVARTEEYFKEAIEIADSEDAAIDFSAYGHFMIIHAGSDWQHDVFGDTPSDLPSFYIRVSEGKEAVVDEGNVLINQACNVPSTISQDFDSYESGGTTYYTGYGALNGVMAHEFGHSLGAVDLYNTYNSAPMVGMFDIMDSGGSGVTEDYNVPGVLIEGELPCLPGAFSRMIMFGDAFKANGLLHEIDQTLNQSGLLDSIQVSASSQKQYTANLIPNLYKIPLNEYEYILVENRSVDPDGDGGTTIKGDLNGRVALYPMADADPTYTPTYEYDYFLPSFIDANYYAIGGGLLVWHVDERVLYQQGQSDAEGNFISNFDRNTVNYSFSHRGVKVIEADGLNDLGYDYSMYWTGTPFEYFHRYKPQLGPFGQFLNWTTDIWRPELNSESTPALIDYLGQPSFFGLKDISQPDAGMWFRLSAGIFDSVISLAGSDTIRTPFPVINSNLAGSVLPVMTNESLHFYFYDPLMGINQWSEQISPIDLGLNTPRFEPVVSDTDADSFKELIIPQNNGIYSVEISTDAPVAAFYNISSADSISCSPLFAFGKLWVATSSNLYLLSGDDLGTLVQTGFNGGANKLAADSENLILQQEHNLIVADPLSLSVVENYSLPEACTQYEPVIVKLAESSIHPKYYLVVSDEGNIYKCFQGKVTSIFHNLQSGEKSTNLAISMLGDYSPAVLFGISDKLYAITLGGTLLPGFPAYLEGFTAKPLSHIKVRHSSNSKLKTESDIIFLNLIEGGLLAINPDGRINRLNSMIDMHHDNSDRTYWDTSTDKLFWIYNNSAGSLLAAELDEQTVQPFHWSGFRNGQNGFVETAFYEPVSTSAKIDAYMFPNPVRDNGANLRIENPSGKISLHVYDISGKLLYKNNYTTEAAIYRDIYLDVSKYSSGVYIAVVENRNQIKRCKFAVQK